MRTRVPARTTANTLAADLADLVHDLHELLESYAPPWYTKKTDDRVSKMLVAADQALRASAS